MSDYKENDGCCIDDIHFDGDDESPMDDERYGNEDRKSDKKDYPDYDRQNRRAYSIYS